MADKMGGFSGGNMLQGLKNRSPSCEDSSTKLPKGKGVDSEPTRSEIAPAPTTIGPRVA